MHYCPDCNAPYAENEYQCPRCGYSPSEEKTGYIKPEPTYQPPQQTYIPPVQPQPPAGGNSKAPIIIGIVVAVLLVIGLAGLGWYKYNDLQTADQYRKSFAAEWKAVATASGDLTAEAGSLSGAPDLKPLAGNIETYKDGLVASKARLEAMNVPGDRAVPHRTAIDAIGDLISYADALFETTDNEPQKVSEAALADVDESSAEAQGTVAAAATANPFLDRIDERLFVIGDEIKPIVTAARARAVAAAKAEAARKAAAEKARLEAERKKQEEEARAANMRKARNVVDDFESSQLNGSYNHAASLLSGTADDNYNASIQGQGDFEMTGYSISSGEVTDLGNYRFYVTEKNKDWQDVYFENRYKFVVNQDSFDITTRTLLN